MKNWSTGRIELMPVPACRQGLPIFWWIIFFYKQFVPLGLKKLFGLTFLNHNLAQLQI
jgi:hypothetical protein